LVEQLTLLMIRHFDNLARAVEAQSSESQTATVVSRLKLVLDEAEKLIVSSISQNLNDHQLIHAQELVKNCLSAIIAVADALLIEQPYEIRDEQTLELHPDLCGLLLGLDAFGGHSRHQRDRVPYAPTRVGREVTYEEIANLFRTSRVNIRRVEQVSCFQKLRGLLQDFQR
jgi:hypothetical protein